MTILGQGTRLDWATARALSPVRAAWREGRPHPEAVSEWLWVVAPVPLCDWWPVVGFRAYAGFGTVHALGKSALDTVEDWCPLIPGTEKGDRCFELLRRFYTMGAMFVRPIDQKHEARHFVLSSTLGQAYPPEG